MAALRADIRGADRLRHYHTRRSADQPPQPADPAGGGGGGATSTGDFQDNLASGTAALFRGFGLN